tara:strand:+ start:9688 stop:10125 length:438 start_codon:yes stop_codon:yes gene_type:complete
MDAELSPELLDNVLAGVRYISVAVGCFISAKNIQNGYKHGQYNKQKEHRGRAERILDNPGSDAKSFCNLSSFAGMGLGSIIGSSWGLMGGLPGFGIGGAVPVVSYQIGYSVGYRRTKSDPSPIDSIQPQNLSDPEIFEDGDHRLN